MRKILTLATLFAFACEPARTSVARYPGASAAFDRAASDPRAVAIADQIVAATGGRERWDRVRQIRWTEAITHAGQPVLAGEQAWDRWNGRHYGRLRRDAGDVIVMRALYSDQHAAFVQRGASTMKIPPDEAQRAIDTADQYWRLDTGALCMPLLLEAPGTKLSYVGPLDDQDHRPRDAIKVELDPRDPTRAGPAFQLLVDRDTHTIVQLEILRADGTAGYTLSQYVDVGGLKFPTTERDLGDAGDAIAFSNIQVGDPDEALYTPRVQ